MDRNDLTLVQLRSAARRTGISTSGSKAELLLRLDSAFPNNAWMEDMSGGSIAGDQSRSQESLRGEGEASNDVVRNSADAEMDLLRREADLMRRELDLACRENEILRNSPRSILSVPDRPKVGLKALGDMLGDFDGSGYTYPTWEKQVRQLRTTFDLDDNTTKILIGTKLRGSAMQWLHSKSEHIEMDLETFLSELKRMFDHQPSKLTLRKKIEDRMWKSNENFSEYYHDKVIMANRIAIEEEELIDFLVDGISDPLLRNQARMQCFKSPSALLIAFDKISQQADSKKTTAVNLQPKNKIHPSSGGDTGMRTVRCFNCNQEGHWSSSCPKPRRERGACYTCGEAGHSFRNCPKTVTESQAKISTSGTTALIDLPCGSPSEDVPHTAEPKGKLSIRTPLTETSHGCCVLVTEALEHDYFIEALVDTGSAINIITESTYLHYFSTYAMSREKCGTNYGGLNKSPLVVSGYITPQIRIK